jgi:hypothetical protein
VELLKKAKVRQFIKENGKHIASVDTGFYVVLEVRVKNMILAAITNNASRRRLTRYELVSNGGNNGNGKKGN